MCIANNNVVVVSGIKSMIIVTNKTTNYYVLCDYTVCSKGER